MCSASRPFPFPVLGTRGLSCGTKLATARGAEGDCLGAGSVCLQLLAGHTGAREVSGMRFGCEEQICRQPADGGWSQTRAGLVVRE